ncbi:hypothetical protein WCLP8_4410006 [uncultured Gammaproteobacteria bacterium]
MSHGKGRLVTPDLMPIKRVLQELTWAGARLSGVW